MENFRNGDFIRLKNMADYKIDRYIDQDVNIFEILEIYPESVIISNCKEKVSLKDIQPIPINGKDDLNIYYDPPIAAPIVRAGDPAPIFNRNYSYYLEAFKRSFYREKTLNEIVLKLGFKYVHEIQHYLFDELHQKSLEIKAR